jgi:hypothetical protein
MWNAIVIEMQAQYAMAERRAEVAAARLSDEVRRMNDCADTERRARRNAPAPVRSLPVAWNGK